MKVIFLGDTDVGKTALIHACIGQPFQDTYDPTISPGCWTLPRTTDTGEEVVLHLWDTAGQERYVALSRSFYREAKVAVICHNPGDVKSLVTWTERARNEADSCSVFAVLTKRDLYDEEQLQDDEDLTDQFVEKYNAVRLQTSAKTMYGVEDLLNELTRSGVDLNGARTAGDTIVVIKHQNIAQVEQQQDCC
jgi:small GTP-binding protein